MSDRVGMVSKAIDWTAVLELTLLSRAIDLYEEKNLYPLRVPYQFSARGHELSQVLLGHFLSHPKDAVGTYYRGRALLLSLGLTPKEAFLASLAKADSYSGGRDIGVVANMPSRGAARVLPVAGDVGSQYTPAAGWAEALRYYAEVLCEPEYEGAIALAHGGDGSIATNGFWAALNIATTRRLPLLFFIEDNGYAISVPAHRQTPGGNIAANLKGYGDLKAYESSCTDPANLATTIQRAVEEVRNSRGPALLRVEVPRLAGHSGQDLARYKSDEQVVAERRRDPIEHLARFLQISSTELEHRQDSIDASVHAAFLEADAGADPNPALIYQHRFSENKSERAEFSNILSSAERDEIGRRRNMVDAIRLSLATEMRNNPKMLILGEDVGAKGGVHTATLGLREEFGERRVIDTSLSEEGIIGVSVGLALAGLKPVPEIQFRKYADAATEQLVNCGTIRWRTNGRCAAPIVVRMPFGVTRKVGDPWHSVSGESIWTHHIGWHVAIPSTAEDAAGLLCTALQGDDPVLFLEHRALLDAEYARGTPQFSGFAIPFGQARIVRSGEQCTLISWGMMVERCERAIEASGQSVELIDLRTLSPWDKTSVAASVEKTGRLLIVHEDTLTVGFGAEIAAYIAQHLFYHLDAPIQRIAVADVPIPYHPHLTKHVIPGEQEILEALRRVLAT